MKTLEQNLEGITSSHKSVTGSNIGTSKRGLDIVDHGTPQGSSAFGDRLSDSLDPIEQISAQYGLTAANIETYNATGGTVSESDNMFTCSTGTSVGGYGVIRTKGPTVYREGQGLMARFTALFDDGAVANSLQFAGLFNVQDTIAFGYRGVNFGILFDHYGAQEIREFQITGAGNGTLTLTLNSVDYSIPITTGTVEHNAYEIEAWLNANQSVWEAEQVNDKVILKALNVGPLSGTYTIAGASGLTGSFTTLETGAAQTKETILKEDWNGESVTFDETKGNVFMIKVSYLGFGPISFFILDPIDGIFKRVHTIKYQNTSIKPSISNRALKVGWTAASLGSTTDLTVKGASAATFIEGASSKKGVPHAQSNENTAVGSTFEALLTLKGLQTLGGKAMMGRIVLQRLVISTDASKEVVFKISKNATLGETNYTYHDSTDSAVLYDTGNHADTGNAHALYEGQVSGGGDREVNLKDLGIDFYANETVTIFAKVVSGAAANVTSSVVWNEDI